MWLITVLLIDISLSFLTFPEYTQKFKKVYSEEEFTYRKAIYQANIKKMQSIHSFTPGQNQFTDKTPQQMQAYKNGIKNEFQHVLGEEIPYRIKGIQLPASLDWRDEDKVTKVKSQGVCGSCWAFASCADAESTLVINGLYDNQIDLSEQYLVHCTYASDCDGTYYVQYAMNQILDGLPLETTYPYNPFYETSGICQAENKVHIAKRNFFYYNLQDTALQELLQQGPLTITISADDWEYYSSGIFECEAGARRNHAVLLVGYGDGYWLVKNSWGSSWGEDGYIRVSKDQQHNCKIGYEVFTFEKSQCEVPNCAQCGDSFTECSICSDASASIIDGQCFCPEGKYFNHEEQCVFCQVEACETCSFYSNTKCSVCLPNRGLVLNGHTCECEHPQHRMNQRGYCEECLVEGCSRCKEGNPYECIRCDDCGQWVVDGQCRCPSSLDNGENSLCGSHSMFSSVGSCDIVGCSTCSVENICVVCKDIYWAELIDGECICRFTFEKPNSQNICERCQVVGCASCVAGAFNTCHLCADENAFVSDGQCYCSESYTRDADGACNLCHVNGCASCSYHDPNACVLCDDGLALYQGECMCTDPTHRVVQSDCVAGVVPGCYSWGQQGECYGCEENLFYKDGFCFCEFAQQKPNNLNNCEECNVAGCLSCYAGHPYQCVYCQNGLTLNNGMCQCSNSGQLLNSEGICEACEVEGCASCVPAQPNQCARCKDPQAGIVDGQCSCLFVDEFIQGFCSEDRLPQQTISSTQQQNLRQKTTISCEQGQFASYGSCIRCDWKCKECENEKKCTKCKAGWKLVSGQCEECFDPKCWECEGSECEKLGSSNGGMTFEEYEEKYDKHYENDRERQQRKKIFLSRSLQLAALKNSSYKAGITKFSDRTPQEMQKMRGYKPPFEAPRQKKSYRVGKISADEAPTELNWRDLGMVTSVKNQGSCGSCWAFSTAAMAESTLLLHDQANQTIDLSEQYLLQCTKQSSCSGTYYVEYAMNQALQGLPLQQTYPYKPFQSYSGICQTEQRVHISSATEFFYEQTADELISLLQDGPISLTISATDWQRYQSGIFSCSAGVSINHAVLLVGYTEDYWLIKNEWGQDWGEDGYMRLTRQTGYDCAIGNHVFRFKLNGCQVEGCASCAQGTQHVCEKCVDDDAELADDKCVCSEGKSLSISGYCEVCQVLGCEVCSPTDSSTCIECSQGTTLMDGKCSCSNSGQKVNRQGVCRTCYAHDCQFCEVGNVFKCEKCTDSQAYLINGECKCIPPYYMSNGRCKICQTPGCSSCQLQLGNTFCTNCDEDKTLSNFQCSCTQASETMTTQGYCQTCEIVGCQYCSDSTICQQCDPDKTLMDNACHCASGYFLNSEKLCQECEIDFCEECSSASICKKCAEDNLVDDLGNCVCQEDTYQHSSVGVCQLCLVLGCNSCQTNSPHICVDCGDGMLIQDGKCVCANSAHQPNMHGVCQQCEVIGCESCQIGNPSVCAKCTICDTMIVQGECVCTFPQFYLSPSTLTCKRCSVPNCALCEVQEDQCQACTGDFMLIGNSCVCDDDMYIVNELGECQRCLVDHCRLCTPDSAFICAKCSAHMLFLEESGTCECQLGYYLNGDECVKNRQGETNFVMIDDVAARCPSGCGLCLEAGTCYECQPSYYLNNDICRKCHKQCAGCEEADICTECYPGFYLAGNVCDQCSSNCVTCDEEGCNACLPGYLEVGGICVSCMNNCQSCLSVSRCTVCSIGYGVTSTGACVQCLSSCTGCDGDDVRICEECAQGYYLSESTCHSCSSNCISCTQTICQLCDSAYYVDYSSGLCVRRCQLENCFECDSGREKQTCASCLAGYREVNGKCVEDLTCDEDNSCELCPQGMLLHEGSCQECSLSSNCLQCVSLSSKECAQCADRYYLHDGKCHQCSQHCQRCSSEYSCLDCSSGYYLPKIEGSFQGSCLKCSEQCRSCIYQSTNCLSCAQGYQFLGWKCTTQSHIRFRIVLMGTAEWFVTEIATFKEEIIHIIGEKYKEHPEYITIRSLKQGSVIIEGNINVLSREDGDHAHKALTDKLTTIATFMGTFVIQSKFQKQSFPQQENLPEEDYQNIGLIIGLAVGGLALIVIVIVVVILIRRTRSHSPDQENKQTGKQTKKTTISQKQLATNEVV